MYRPGVLILGITQCFWLFGCGTTRMTDSARTATEQMLISEAVDQAVTLIDFRALSGKKVFFDDQHVGAHVDKGYLISSLRQHILAHGCLLQEKREDADYVVEARAGGLGTDRHGLLIGVPEMSLPTVVPGQPSRIPEIPFAKKTDQHGVAKVAVFAYNRHTGQRIWQSGVVKAESTAKDLWLLGAGPFQHGSVRGGRTTLAGESIEVPFIYEDGELKQMPAANVSTTQHSVWPEKPKEKLEKSLTPFPLDLMANVLPTKDADSKVNEKPQPPPTTEVRQAVHEKKEPGQSK